jgi:hypothetical protein
MAAKKHHDAKEAEAEEPGSLDPATTDQPAAQGGLTPEMVATLKQLGELHDQDVLSDEEFAAEKAKILGTSS